MNAMLGPLVNSSKCSGSCAAEPQPRREFASIVKCRVSRKTQVPRYTVLKLYLLIFIDRIFDSRVEGGIPSQSLHAETSLKLHATDRTHAVAIAVKCRIIEI